jgi:hypothetical protein
MRAWGGRLKKTYEAASTNFFVRLTISRSLSLFEVALVATRSALMASESVCTLLAWPSMAGWKIASAQVLDDTNAAA